MIFKLPRLKLILTRHCTGKMSFLGGLIGGVMGLIGGRLSDNSAKDEAGRGRGFTREQMQNRHQWEVADLRAAGLNPILSATGGAPSMGASPTAPIIDKSKAMAIGASTALAAKRVKEEIKNIKADTKKKKAETATTDATGAKITQQFRIDRASEASSAIERKWYSTKMGKFYKAIDIQGRSLNPFASTAKALK